MSEDLLASLPQVWKHRPQVRENILQGQGKVRELYFESDRSSII